MIQQHPDKDDLREKGLIWAHSPRILSIVIDKPWQQELEATDHITSSARKQGVMNPGAQLTYSYF